MIEVLQPGITTIQDLGRKGYEQFGMPRSGAVDPFLARIANKLAGNEIHAALLEFALVGPSLLFHQACSVAVVAHSSRYRLDGKPVPEFETIRVPSGTTLRFEGMEGWFGYLAFSGGLQSEKILGSAAVYASGGIGKRLTQQDRLQIGPENDAKYSIKTDILGLRRDNTLQILEATHTKLFADHARKSLSDNAFTISPQSDRMGIRLEGNTLDTPEVRRSTPTLPGVIQISRSGQPIILGPEGPVTGGYPQIGILSEASWTTLSAIRPGKSIRFEWIQLETARQIQNMRNKFLNDKSLWQTV